MPKRALGLILEWASEHRFELLEDWTLCKKNQVPKKNTSPAVIPSAPWRLINVRPLANYRLEVEFNDGTCGFVEMEKYINNPTSGVFRKLKDLTLFNKVYLAHGAVTWPEDIDLAPDTMHHEIKHHGKWILK
jgi:hypothetical protein